MKELIKNIYSDLILLKSNKTTKRFKYIVVF